MTETKKVVWPTKKETVQTTGDRVCLRGGHGGVPVASSTRASSGLFYGIILGGWKS
ncbi:MAG: preprotein translocase subunit SecE [Rhodocyclaceae bacterium]